MGNRFDNGCGTGRFGAGNSKTRQNLTFVLFRRGESSNPYCGQTRTTFASSKEAGKGMPALARL